MMPQSYQQLPLRFEPLERFTFDAFVSGKNNIAIELLQQCVLGVGETQLLLWGDRSSGKSHLLQAACNLASQSGRSVCYLPVAEIVHVSPQVFEGLEQLDLVCIDDVHVLMQLPDWEESLFDLINRIRETDKRIVFTSQQSPDTMTIGIADLRSRLGWGPVFQLQDLNDTDKVKALQKRADQYGLEMADNVATYLLTHYPRDLFGLFERLDHLDKASMALQRRLTIPFIKTVLGSSD